MCIRDRPWVLAKNEADKDRLDNVLRNLSEAIRIISILIHPFMHTTAETIRKQMGLDPEDVKWNDAFAVSYTHLDVYKRQTTCREHTAAE